MVTLKAEADPRWLRTLNAPETLADDLGALGAWVGPRTGPDKRTHGQKEDYVLRRLLVAWKLTGHLRFSIEIRATTDEEGEPDFLLCWPDGQTLGVEVTEAGEEDYQAWLTRTEREREAGKGAASVPFEPSTQKTADNIRERIEEKVAKFDSGSYRSLSACDLVLYDNTAWGGFLDKRELLKAIGRPNHLLGRFRQIHFVTGGFVLLDLFGPDFQEVNVRNSYEIDYAGWIFDQVEHLRRGETEELDLLHIAEELEDLGKSERRALGSHLRSLLLHLLKWEFQPKKRGESWILSIDNARSEIHEILTEMPSLRRYLEDIVETEYRRARRSAAREAGLTVQDFPEGCPYDLEGLVDPEFLPEREPERGKS